MRTQWTTKGNRDAGSSCSCDRGLHRYLRNFGGGKGVEHPKPPHGTPLLEGELSWQPPSVRVLLLRNYTQCHLFTDRPASMKNYSSLYWWMTVLSFRKCISFSMKHPPHIYSMKFSNIIRKELKRWQKYVVHKTVTTTGWKNRVVRKSGWWCGSRTRPRTV